MEYAIDGILLRNLLPRSNGPCHGRWLSFDPRRRSGRVEGYRGPVSKAFAGTRALADGEHTWPICPSLVSDVLEPECVVVAHATAGNPRWRAPRPGLHHPPRLRARFVF